MGVHSTPFQKPWGFPESDRLAVAEAAGAKHPFSFLILDNFFFSLYLDIYFYIYILYLDI